MKRNLTVVVFCLVAGIILLANSPAQAQSRTPWADSLRRAALSPNEPSLQHIFDSLGYNINVATDELGKELFCGKGGLNTATMVIEVAGSAVYAMSGYYKKSDTSTFYQLFGPSAGPGDSVTFTFSSFDSIGFYMKPNLPGDPHTWLTQNALNADGFNHAKVFSTGVLHEYLIAWEDLPNGGDQDWNDLVIKVNFKNFPPQIHLCGHLDDTPDENSTACDTSIVQCTSQPVCINITAYDPNCQGDSITVTKISGNGTFAAVKGFRNLSTQHCFTPAGPGTYTFVFKVTDQLGASDQDTIHIIVTQGTKPTVVVRDTTLFLCSPSQVCLPISITDPNCDITSVTSTLGSYSGTVSGFDQVQRLVQLGGTVTQVGGGQPGKVLTVGSDFVAPVNTQSGVSVTLPNFAFASTVVDAGSFTTGVGPTNSATQLLGAPTNLTYTTVGAGGPDGGNGDGALDFATNNFCRLGFPQTVTSCNGSDVDMFLFTNTLGGGTAELRFQNGNTIVKTLSLTIPSGGSGSGLGGIAIDLPDGVTYNQLRIKATSGTFDVDAVAVRTAPSSSTADICFMADTTGTYRVIVTATDSCGNIGADTALALITINRPPVANAGSDLTRFLCSSSQICFPVTFTDPDNNIKTKELTSGTGTLTGSTICYTPAVSGSTSFIIKVTDSCGAIDFDTVLVTATLNAPPVATNGPTTTKFLCSSTQQCYQFAATDPNGGTLTWSMLSGTGTITSGGNWCFTPAASGTYNASVVVTDSCGAIDTATITYTVTLNAKPVAVNPATPVNLFQCSATQVCYQFGASDANGGSLVWTKLSGSGSVTSGGNWCFTPAGSGAYTAVVKVEDSCGAADTTTLTYNVTVNGAPTLAFGNDTTLNLCNPQQVCLAYTVSDPQGLGKLTEAMISGFGSIDTANNKICFTPSTTGTFTFIASVTDSCGLSKVDTVVANVTMLAHPQISCPSGPINLTLCQAGQVCQALAITPANATVTTNLGTYSGGQLCFTANTTGTYNAQVIATTSCGADTCNLTFNVTISQPPDLVCPGTQNVFICAPGQVCIPVGGAPVATWTVTPIGTYSSGNVCFNADTTGHYVLKVKASTPCGIDSCNLVVDVTVNSRPVAVDPPSSVDTFLCAAAQICRQFTAGDPNGGTLSWTRLSGAGTVTSGGQWCFTANASGAYAIIAKVSDSCGAADTVSMTYNVTINTPPTLSLGPDTTIFQCLPGQVCLSYTLTDPNNNGLSASLLSGTGTLSTGPNTLCFTPTVAGVYTFVVEASDNCNAKARDTINVTVNLNRPPVVNAGSDQTVFQCTQQGICWPTSASDPDGNLATVQLISGPGTYASNQICFTPTGTLNYEFVLKATDACGLVAYDTVVVYYTLNSPPVAHAGNDTTVFQCSPASICMPANCTDPNGNLTTCALISGPGSYDGTNICFTPATSGNYTFIIEATDACNLKGRDTVVAHVTLNSGPVCHIPNDTTIFQCATTQVCLPVSATDADNNLTSCQILSGPGSLAGGNWCYTPSGTQSVTVQIKCTDACGAECTSQFKVDFIVNQPPQIAFGADTTMFLCASTQVCLPYTAFDPNDPRPRTITLVSGPGTLDLPNSQVCFTPAATGTYSFVVKIQDECGASAQDTISVGITLNQPPVASAGPDQTKFVCDSLATICWPASCSDPNSNLATCLFNGPGTYDGSQICFQPAITGAYLFTLKATDSCGATVTDTVVVNVTINGKPNVVFGTDTTLFLCAPQQICLGYMVTDPNGMAKLTETMVSGFGSIDTALNKICFTPSASGTYDFIVSVTDSCGATDLDTIRANVTFGEHAHINCLTSPITASLCATGQVCQAISITPASATVTTSFGTYSGGNLCFQADSSGTYNIRIIASTACSSDTCNLTFNVTIGQAAQITCPAPQTRFICQAGSVCIPVTVMGAGATVTVTPIGTYSAGNVCFQADTTGHYVLKVKASTTCGSDSCQITADITINSRPVAVNPATPKDTFLCASAQICYQFAATDPNGGSLTWNKLSGAGSISPSGAWCFTPGANGAYTAVAVVSDSCGAADTTTLTYNVTLNLPPTVTLGPDKVKPICLPGQICVNYTVADPNNNAVLEQLISGPGTIDTLANTVCFTAAVSGTTTLVVKVTDACGATAQDTINVVVNLNQPPVISAGADISVFQCTPAQLCYPITASDPNNNLDSVKVISGTGTIVNNAGNRTICFTPSGSGVYTFILRAVDSCGASAQDTVAYTVTVNAPPVCVVPNDTVIFQCIPTPVSLALSGTDPDNNFDHCEIVSGPGSIVSGHWNYTPSGDEIRKVVVMCVDQCGAICKDSFNIEFKLNAPPVVNSGKDTTYFMCQSGTICWPVTASDEDHNLMSVQLLSGPGSYNTLTHQICANVTFAEGQTQVLAFVVKATDSCNAVSYDTTNVTVKFNHAPVISAPPDFTAYLDQVGQLCFDVNVTDADNNLNTVTVSPVGTYNSTTHQICFTATTTGQQCLVITATDACNRTVVDTVCIEVVIDECIHVQIEKSHDVLQGRFTDLNIFLNGSGKKLGGFDLLVAYDASALTPMGVTLGQLLTNCGWEYFTYRQGANGNCGSACPSGLLRIVALAETNNGAYHPTCYFDNMVGSMATIQFLVSNDRTLECQFSPVSFYWIDCNDNSFSSKFGDTLWVSRNVYSLELTNIANYNTVLPGYFGIPNQCIINPGPGKISGQRCVDFINGGVDIVCADSIDARGDINLNSVSYEVADAVMFTNYFVVGLSAFGNNPQHVQGSIAASDVNADGLSLTVADLVYLIRVIAGDAVPTPKVVAGHEPKAEIAVNNGILEISKTEVPVGALYIVLNGNVHPQLHEAATNMEMKYGFDGTDTRVLVFAMNGRAFLDKGPVLYLKDGRGVKSVEAGSYNGEVIATKLHALPTTYELSQNYPNPFNPMTTIEFALPTAGKWSLSIYNILGQEVATFGESSDAGYYKIEWDAGRYASGVYLYRLTAGNYSATRKMVLLK